MSKRKMGRIKLKTKMGKHRTLEQDEIFLKFMRNNEDIAKGFTRGDRVAVAAAWKELKKELNASGPPCVSEEERRGIWMDWKLGINRKLPRTTKKPIKAGGIDAHRVRSRQRV
ncbi:uncharacterized protein LOC111081678 isoform X1 [Drosophila obscura]|uniref:uncharacterized protein LOC111081678 isoform X1 n=1 Tax=Drosophila obscura TaxID=7282 RepID=UPI001BB15FD3|nr:uncharacterized protein LOC111081678 isoform X1 [Drosophila obscura]